MNATSGAGRSGNSTSSNALPAFNRFGGHFTVHGRSSNPTTALYAAHQPYTSQVWYKLHYLFFSIYQIIEYILGISNWIQLDYLYEIELMIWDEC